MVRALAVVLLAMAAAPAMAFQNYAIYSGSMEPTLLEGDFLIAWAYGAGTPARGDIVVFRNDTVNYVKRVVGLPGETIQLRDGRLYIDDVIVPRVDMRKNEDFDPLAHPGHVIVYREILPDSPGHLIYEMTDTGYFDNTQRYTVPEGQVFVLGDNRDNSLDSRAMSDVGFVPFDEIRGRGTSIYFSFDNNVQIWEVWRWAGNARWDRSFTSVYP